MKHAEAILKELALHVQPPRGCVIVLTEWKLRDQNDPNWVAASGNIVDTQKLVRYGEKIAELRRTDAIIDWSDVKMITGGSRRVVVWPSQLDGD